MGDDASNDSRSEQGTVDRPDQGADIGGASDSTTVETWILIAGIVLALIVVPLVIYVDPPGLPFEVAFLVLPLLPAVLLATLAVWTGIRTGERS